MKADDIVLQCGRVGHQRSSSSLFPSVSSRSRNQWSLFNRLLLVEHGFVIRFRSNGLLDDANHIHYQTALLCLVLKSFHTTSQSHCALSTDTIAEEEALSEWPWRGQPPTSTTDDESAMARNLNWLVVP